MYSVHKDCTINDINELYYAIFISRLLGMLFWRRISSGIQLPPADLAKSIPEAFSKRKVAFGEIPFFEHAHVMFLNVFKHSLIVIDSYYFTSCCCF